MPTKCGFLYVPIAVGDTTGWKLIDTIAQQAAQIHNGNIAKNRPYRPRKKTIFLKNNRHKHFMPCKETKKKKEPLLLRSRLFFIKSSPSIYRHPSFCCPSSDGFACISSNGIGHNNAYSGIAPTRVCPSGLF